MSTYTPCFPSKDPLSSSTSSGTSTGSAPQTSFGARLSRAHLALASVSDNIERPPSPTSAAVNVDHVVQIRRKFRVAVAAAYRDTSSGKWGHVSELARLGCTIGRWQGVCTGSKAPLSLCPPSAGDRNDQGVVDGPQPGVNPYPRPPVPIFDLGEIRERVENWKASVAPLSQLDNPGPSSSQPQQSAEDAVRLSPLNFPTVKRRKSDVAKAMKRKRKASSDRDYTTSRYFRGDGLADRMSLEAQAVNRNAECVTPVPRSVARRRSNAKLTPHSRAESQDQEDPERHSPTPAPVPENIHQIAEAFLPPSFPSQLQTSTPPPCDRLIKPPVIPRAEGLFFSASLPSPQPFPRSQQDPGPASQPPYTRSSRHDIPSPASAAKSKRRAVTMAAPNPPSSRSNSEPPPPPRDLDLDPTPNSLAGPAGPLIDLHQLASQRSRDSQPRHHHHSTRIFAVSSSPMTPAVRARGLKGKSRAMTTIDLSSPRGEATLSRALSLPAVAAAAPQTQTPPLSPPLLDFTFAPMATSTQVVRGLGTRGSGVVRDVDGDGEGWARDVPVVEADCDVDVDVGVGEDEG